METPSMSVSEMLALPVMEFFTTERLRTHADSDAMASRAHKRLRREYGDAVLPHTYTLRQFLEYKNTRRRIRYMWHVGEKTADVIVKTLEAAGFTVKER